MKDIVIGVLLVAALTVMCSVFGIPKEEEHVLDGDGTQYAGGENVVVLGDGSQPAEKIPDVQEVEYELTAEERDLIERVVMGEAGGESLLSQKAVAQCILNACLITGDRPESVIEGLQYTSHRPAASEQVKGAVSAIFDEGEKVVAENVMYFYNPDLVVSEWHESQKYICTIEDHRYFARWSS